MNVLIVSYHPEPKSFNGAMLQAAVEQLQRDDHGVQVTDLNKENFNPVSGRHNFASIKDENYFKQQIEEIHADESGGFADDIERELSRLENCDLMIWQFPLW